MGVLITVSSYILEPILNRLQKRRQHKSYDHLEWISNNSLRLHRMAHEQLDGREWAKCTEDTPTTDPEICLANLDISDPEHPILRRPQAPQGKTEAVEANHVAAHSSSYPSGGSVPLDNAADLSGRISTLSMTSVSNGSWLLDVRTAIMNFSGQLSVEEREPGGVGGDMMGGVDRERQVEAIP